MKIKWRLSFYIDIQILEVRFITINCYNEVMIIDVRFRLDWSSISDKGLDKRSIRKTRVRPRTEDCWEVSVGQELFKISNSHSRHMLHFSKLYFLVYFTVTNLILYSKLYFQWKRTFPTRQIIEYCELTISLIISQIHAC